MTFLVSSWHFFDRFIDDCIGLSRGRVRGGISLLLILFHWTFVHEKGNIRLCMWSGIRLGMAESGVNHRKWKGGNKGAPAPTALPLYEGENSVAAFSACVH